MGSEEKFDIAKDKVAGQAKEGVGKVTGDKSTETEGKTQQLGAEVREKVEDAKDTIKGAIDGLGKK